jgi:pimeloyl-ACP methyl ester carboxylesterase
MREDGQGVITVIAVHGNGGGASRWALLPRPLAPDVALHAVTLPGFEGRPLPDGPVTMATFADALRAVVRAAPRPRVVLGHGIGGSIALDALGGAGAEIDGIILHAPVGARLDTRAFPRLMAAPPVRRAVRLGISSLPARLVGRLVLFRSAPPGTADRFLREYRRCEAFEPMFDLLTAEWFAGLEPVAVPGLLLWGSRDRVLDVDHLADFQRLVPRATRHVEPGWGHFPMLDEPDGYAAVVARSARGLAGCG